MSDPSSDEHLAPVSYLPWAVPGQSPGRADSVAESADGDAAESRATHPAARRAARQRPTGARLVAIGGGDTGSAETGRAETGPAETSRAETGAERDERIDRLVVSRLRRSSLSVAEVRDVLVEHGLDDAEVDEWIERYERLGYLDDARLAEQVVHVQTSRRGRGSSAILSELGRRGIDPAVAREAVESLDPDAEREQAIEVAERRYRQLRGLDRSVAERRLGAFLQRRGYPGDVVRDVVSQVVAADRS